MPNFSNLNPNWISINQSQSSNHFLGEGRVRMPIGFQLTSINTSKIKMEMPERQEDVPITLPPPPPPPNPRPGPDKPPRPGGPNPSNTGGSPNPGLATSSTFDGQRVYALLIGIDHYDFVGPDGQTIHLGGCVNDSREMEKYLKENVDQPQTRLFLRKLRSPRPGNEDQMPTSIACASEELFSATRQNIIRSFREFLEMAREGDVVFIHYSGHGSFEFRPTQLQHISREDNVDQQGGVLIAQDSYVIQNDRMIEAISDLELRWMLRRISDNGPHIVSLMDCCYSAGNTRNFDTDGTVSRFAEPPSRLTTINSDGSRPLWSYAFYEEDPSVKMILDSDHFTDFELPLARGAVSLSGCRENELSKEDRFPEGRHGVFTYYALQVLRATGGNISYRDLIKLVRAKVVGNARISFQSPQIDAMQPEVMNLGFLSGKMTANPNYYTVRPSDTSASEGIMDAGSLHGIANPDEGATHIELYPANVNLKEANPQTALKGTLSQVHAHESTIRLTGGQTFPTDTAFMKAVVTAAPLPQTKVRLMTEVEKAEVDLVNLEDHSPEKIALNQGLQLLNEALGKSKYFQVVGPEEDYGYHIYTYLFEGEEKYRITRKDDKAALITPVVGFNSDAVEQVVGQMDHIARWEKTLKLTPTQNPIIQPGDIEIVALHATTKEVLDSPNGEVLLTQKQQADGSWPKPEIKVRISMKKANEFYYASLIQLTRDFGIDTQNYLPPGAMLGVRKWTEGNESHKDGRIEWFAAEVVIDKNGRQHEFAGGLPIQFGATDPDSLLKNDIDTVEEHFKLIVSTEEFDALYLEQKGIELASTTRAIHRAKPKNQLEALMSEAGGGSRGDIVFPSELEAPTAISDWSATTLTIKTKLVKKEE